MNTLIRLARVVALALATVAVLAIPAGAVQAAPLAGDDLQTVAAGLRPLIHDSAVKVSPAPCADPAYRLLGAKWNSPYEWSFRAASTPNDLNRATVTSVLVRSFDNITGARNDCGLADRVSVTHDYLGTTSQRPNCRSRDGHNVIGFGKLQFGVLAVTCYWIRNGEMVEADIKINSREFWALSLASCRNEVVLEATITHEAGHVFGLDHVGERRHGRLTMSPFLDGPCKNGESTLGLGDIRGLERLY